MACLFFSQNLIAKIIKDDKLITNVSKYSFDEVCFVLTQRKAELIDYANINELNCMGQKVEVSKFCDQKEAGNPYYIRALAEKKSKQVHCLSSKKVIIKYECEGESDQYCKDAEIGCFLLKEKLAKRLRIVHESLTENKKYLSCYFEAKVNNMDINL